MKPNRSGNCKICGIWRRVLHRDHVVPRHKGGTSEMSNIQLICANCHQDKTEIELRAAQTGRIHPPEVRAKMSASRRDHKVSQITRDKIGMSGWSDERCAKISAAKMGHEVNDETRAKISSSLSGRPLSEEHRKNVCAAIAKRFS